MNVFTRRAQLIAGSAVATAALVTRAGVGLALICGMIFSAAAATNSTSSPGAAARWWSLVPLVRPAMPSGATHPIDAFIRAKLSENQLRPTSEADRRTLIRRLAFDLTGLPPTPAEVEAFLADKSPAAYEALVDRFLASPAHGERWARHWLDVVHYGETHGYDKDKPRLNAWPYRDYVIRSFNQDKPYSRFVQEQIAGDVLFPGTADGFEALGFIAAGPWDFIGHAEVSESKIDGKIARHLDRDDMVANTMQTFVSLTVQCAQCHNHKFDPISQEEYYNLQSVFAAVDRADQKYDRDPAVAAKRRELGERRAVLESERKDIDTRIRARAGQSLTNLEERISVLAKPAGKSDAFGYHSNIEKKADVAKWVQIDLGRRVALGGVRLHPCKDDFNGIGEGFGFPVRFKIEVSDDPEFATGVEVVADRTGVDVPNPKLTAMSFDAAGRSGRHLRVTATRLAPRQDDFIFAIAELAALSAAGDNVARGAVVTALDSIEAPARWQRKNLTDGWYPGALTGDATVLADLRRQRDDTLAKATYAGETDRITALGGELSATRSAASNLPPQSAAYIAAVHHGSGTFIGTGAKRGKPRTIHFLNRGDVLKPGRESRPGALGCVPGVAAEFELPAAHSEGERRAALARWLTDTNNPLPWRSLVNRVWQHHFGRGLVDTPNDFGRMGGAPSHPALLDWLAVEFRDGGQSLKRLHRLIVTSATYRQRSTLDGRGNDTVTARAVSIDADNRLLWRQNRRKLEAESLRDAVLFVAGKLNHAMGGPSYQDFVIDKPEHSPHYEYHLHDPDDPRSHRRSIYRLIVRSQPQPFMNALDCADPSMQVGRRNESVSPLQALAVLNNAVMLTMSRHFATKLEAAPGSLAERIRRAHTEALGRPPTREETRALERHAREHGLANACRLIFNLNEFAFVD